MKKFQIESALQNFHIRTPLVYNSGVQEPDFGVQSGRIFGFFYLDWIRGGNGTGGPESTPEGFCVFLSDPDPARSQKFEKKRTQTRSHFSILAVAGICVVIS